MKNYIIGFLLLVTLASKVLAHSILFTNYTQQTANVTYYKYIFLQKPNYPLEQDPPSIEVWDRQLQDTIVNPGEMLKLDYGTYSIADGGYTDYLLVHITYWGTFQTRAGSTSGLANGGIAGGGTSMGLYVDSSPSISSIAFDAALDGASRYAQTFMNNILSVFNPQTYANTIGTIAGFLVNIQDPLGRANTAIDLANSIRELGVAQNWIDAANYFTTPEGLAGITSNFALTTLQSGFGNIKITNSIPQAVTEDAKIWQGIGATGKVGQDWLENTIIGEKQAYYLTPQGKRFIDLLGSDMVAYESKVGYQSLTKAIDIQISKDAYLLQSGLVSGVEWHFFESPVTGLTGPSQNLGLRLKENNIKIKIHKRDGSIQTIGN